MSAPNIPDLSGKKIGEYEIVKRIGVGGMGAVYEGRQPLIGKRVAVKVLLPSLSNEQELVERFLAEARSVNEIRHRGIVDIFSFGQLPEGSHYFVMEYLEGEPFDRIVKQRAPLPLGEALAWTDEVLDALDAAHSAGIIHRDIKPSNLFLVNTGRGRPYVKLLDFGIAKLGAFQGEATPQTRASVILGTPDYISPEQARGKPISPQTDLYALGCVLFELVTGARVFKGENTLQTMWSHVEDEPPVPSSLRPDIPPQLDDAILWALQKAPENRPPSAAALREVLESLRMVVGPSGFTPPPITGGHKPLAHTPPPSGRSRAVGTPAPRSGAQPPLKTPSPASLRTGGQPPLPSEQTRVAPPTAVMDLPTAASRPAVSRSGAHAGVPPSALEAAERSTDAAVAVVPGPSAAERSTDAEVDVIAPPTSKLPFIVVGAVALLLLVVGGVVLTRDDDAATAPPAPAVVEAPPAPTPTPVQKDAPPDIPVEATTQEVPQPEAPVVDPKPVAVVDPPQPEPKPEPSKPKPTGITTEKLVARMRKVEAALASKESETGARDNVMRQFVEQAKKQVRAASNDSERREAWNFLGDLERQLKR